MQFNGIIAYRTLLVGCREHFRLCPHLDALWLSLSPLHLSFPFHLCCLLLSTEHTNESHIQHAHILRTSLCWTKSEKQQPKKTDVLVFYVRCLCACVRARPSRQCVASVRIRPADTVSFSTWSTCCSTVPTWTVRMRPAIRRCTCAPWTIKRPARVCFSFAAPSVAPLTMRIGRPTRYATSTTTTCVCCVFLCASFFVVSVDFVRLHARWLLCASFVSCFVA